MPAAPPIVSAGISSKKINDGHIENLAEMIEPARADAIGAALILLHLLKRQIQRLAEFLLTHTLQGALQPGAATDVNIDRIRIRCHIVKILLRNFGQHFYLIRRILRSLT